ncbi:MAG: transglutaminase domain-containing protein [Candidatus Lokiarchaeota archaeon]|nr:transglutaminase domain-containing protein [Candidatus Lokiarchaeota archaeon]MCK4780563.1 transglutaminase domain-containing protein [Candidatus Lokiarchaeota archaeon]
MEDISIYLQPTEFFDFNKKSVSKKALEITSGLKTEKEKAVALFYWVRDEIKYNMLTYIPNVRANFRASVTLRRMNGFCVSKSILLSSFARAIGIPARIHLVDLINHLISQKVIDFMGGTNVMYVHGYSEIYLNGKWVKLTPSFDPKTAIKGKFLPMVEFDGENDAVFPKFDIEGNQFGEYLADRGVYVDLPLEEIDKIFEEKYPSYAVYKKGGHLKQIKEKTLTYKKIK